MEIAQTGTDAWPWCMGMFGARFAVFVRRARVLKYKKIYIAVALISILSSQIVLRSTCSSTFTCINLATVDLDHSVRRSTRVYLVLVPRAVTKAFYMFVLHVPGVHVYYTLVVIKNYKK
jgi:hypothetical protein